MYRQTLLTLALLLGLCSQAQAITISASYDGMAASGSVYRNIDGKAYSLSGGQMTFTLAPGQTDLPEIGTSTLYGWCIEPFESIGYSSYTWELQDLQYGTTNISGMGETRANYLRELFYYVVPDFSVLVSAETALALQIATWEIVRDDAIGNFQLSSGNASFSSSNPSGAIALAQGWLDAVVNDGDTDPMLSNVYAATLNGTQDIIFQMGPAVPPNNASTSEVATPATWLLLGLALPWLARRRA